MKSCKFCKFSGAAVGADKSMSLVCRVDPPKVAASPISTPQGLAWATMTVWPAVTENDWCESRFQPNLNG